MQGFAIIFFAAWAMVRDLGKTLRIAVAPLVLAAVICDGLLRIATGTRLSVSAVARLAAEVAPLQAATLIACATLLIVPACWVGLRWHRHILLKRGGVMELSRWKGARAAYPGYIRAVLTLAVPGLAIVLMIEALMVPLVPRLGFAGPGGEIAVIAISALLVSLLLRLGLVLPAAAMGRPFNMADSWAATRGYSGPVYAIALVIVLIAALLRHLTGHNPAAWLLEATGYWAGALLFVGALSVLYGVRVEGRRLIL